MSLSIQKCIDFSKKFLLKSLLHTDKKTHTILPATSHKHTFQGKITEKKSNYTNKSVVFAYQSVLKVVSQIISY